MSRHPRMLSLCVCALVASSAAFAADKPATTSAPKNRHPAAGMTTMEQAKPKTDAAHDAMMAEMAKLGAPGEQHAWLKGCEGKWKATVKSWYAPGEPTVSEGTSDQKMVLGGRFLEQRFKSALLGQPFEGIGFTAYDNVKQEFQSYWIDTWSTQVMVMTGALDPGRKVLTLKGSMPGPDGAPMTMKSVTKIVDEKTQVFSMYAVMGEQDQLMMEITYSRL